jgi:hypothetical protein
MLRERCLSEISQHVRKARSSHCLSASPSSSLAPSHMHSDPSLFPTHGLLPADRPSSRLSYRERGDGYYDPPHVDVYVDVYVDVVDCHQERNLILNRKMIPRLRIHQISEVYGRCNKLNWTISLTFSFLMQVEIKTCFSMTCARSFHCLLHHHPMQLAVRFEGLREVEVCQCDCVCSMRGPKIQDEAQHLLLQEFWSHLRYWT